MQAKIAVRKRTWLRLAVFPICSALVGMGWFDEVNSRQFPSPQVQRRCHSAVLLSNLASGLAISFVVVPPVSYKRVDCRLPVAPGEMLAFSCGVINLPQLWSALRGPPSLSTFIILTSIYVFLVLRHFQPFMIVLIGVCFLAAWNLGSETSLKANASGLLVWFACLFGSVVLLLWGPPIRGLM